MAMLFASAATGQGVLGAILVPKGAMWKYQDKGVDLDAIWQAAEFDDRAWPAGPAPLGFGEADQATTLDYGPDPENKFVTYYFRHAFTVDDPGAFNRLYLWVRRDDGVVVYLNGTEVYRDNVPSGGLGYQTLALTNVYGAGGRIYYESNFAAFLRPGTNLLAAEVHQAGFDSVDLVFDLQLAASNVVLLTRGPYLQSCTSTSIVVRWRTDWPTDSQVRCGASLDKLDLTFGDPALTTEHEVCLEHLQPETRYCYAIGSSTTELASSASLFFVTAPPPGQSRPTRIWFVSDYGFGDTNEIAVRDSYSKVAAVSRPADVWLTGGDNDQIVGKDAHIQVCIFGIYGPLLSHTCIFPTLGNHDTYTFSIPGPYPYFDNFSFPTNGEAGGVASGSERYYSFDYGNVHFINLDAITPSLSASPDSPMLQWLRRDLAANTRPWKIAYWHGPPYTKGSHDSDALWDLSARMIQMREQVLPVLESYGVDLVLCGHSHVYERSYLLYGHYGYSWTFSETNKINGGNGQEDGDGPYRQRGGKGTVYVVAGVGGQPRGFFFGSHPAHLVKIGTELGSCLVDVNEDRLDLQFINTEAEALDHFTLLKETPLRIVYVNKDPSVVTLKWTSTPGEWYNVFMRTNVAATGQLVAGQIPSQGDLTLWAGAVPTNLAMGFFFVSTSTPLRISDIRLAQNAITLTWSSVPGVRYRVFMRDSLDGPPRMIAEEIQAQGAMTSWSRLREPTETMQFFSVSTCSD